MKNEKIYNLASDILGYMKKEDTGKILYSAVYKKVKKYLDENHPGSRCSDILKTKDGWSCIIMEDGKKTALYITKTEAQGFSFWENEI